VARGRCRGRLQGRPPGSRAAATGSPGPGIQRHQGRITSTKPLAHQGGQLEKQSTCHRRLGSTPGSHGGQQALPPALARPKSHSRPKLGSRDVSRRAVSRLVSRDPCQSPPDLVCSTVATQNLGSARGEGSTSRDWAAARRGGGPTHDCGGQQAPGAPAGKRQRQRQQPRLITTQTPLRPFTRLRLQEIIVAATVKAEPDERKAGCYAQGNLRPGQQRPQRWRRTRGKASQGMASRQPGSVATSEAHLVPYRGRRTRQQERSSRARARPPAFAAEQHAVPGGCHGCQAGLSAALIAGRTKPQHLLNPGAGSRPDPGW